MLLTLTLSHLLLLLYWKVSSSTFITIVIAHFIIANNDFFFLFLNFVYYHRWCHTKLFHLLNFTTSSPSSSISSSTQDHRMKEFWNEAKNQCLLCTFSFVYSFHVHTLIKSDFYWRNVFMSKLHRPINFALEIIARRVRLL